MTALSGASEPRAVILSGIAAKDLCRRDAGATTGSAWRWLWA